MHQLCVHRDMKHVGSLERTEEDRVALGNALSNSYASFVLSKLPTYLRACVYGERTLAHEPIVKFVDMFSF